MLVRLGVLVAMGALVAACVDVRYPPGARDGGGFVAHLSTGQSCGKDGDCQSGFCAGGVCCTTKCDMPCYTCAGSSNPGFCMPAIEGMNPGNRCPTDDPSTCGSDGTCDGAGACRMYAAGTECKKASCFRADITGSSRCDGMGSCVTPAIQSCRPFQCGADMKCLTSCAQDEDCVSPIRCDMATCGLLPLGSPCGTNNNLCDSKFCKQGICCATDCTGGCKSCAVKGSEGTCTNVPAGAGPFPAEGQPATTKFCEMTDISTCGQDGTCDGAGGCRFYSLGKVCAPASCSNAALRPAGTCDGKAKCQVPTTVTCGGYTCSTATSCRTTCAADPDCASPSVCGSKDHACGGLSAQYFRQTNLTDLAFMRTDERIDFNWFGGSPTPQLNADNFSVRWRGKITPRFTEPYLFFSGSDDGERLIVGGQILIDRFTRHASVPEDVATRSINLVAGQPVDITFEYFENGGDASVYLAWQSKSEPKAVVPTSALAPQ